MRETRLSMTGQPKESNFHLFPKILYLNGILSAKRQDRCLRAAQISSAVLLHFYVLEICVMVTVASKASWYAWKPNVAYLISTASTLTCWHSLHSNRIRLAALLDKAKIEEKGKISAAIFVVSVFLFAFPFVQASITTDDTLESYFSFFSLGFEFGDRTVKWLYILMQQLVLSSSFLYFNFSCLVAFLALCRRASALLSDFERDLVAASSDFAAAQGRLVKKYRMILDLINDIQTTFSTATFYLCVTFITSDFGSISLFFLSPLDLMRPSVVLEHAFMAAFNTVSLFSLIYVPAQIPIRMAKVKSAFFRIHAQHVPLLCNADEQVKVYVLNRMMDVPEIVLSGCNIIQYRKATILVVLSCFITYGLFLIDFKI